MLKDLGKHNCIFIVRGFIILKSLELLYGNETLKTHCILLSSCFSLLLRLLVVSLQESKTPGRQWVFCGNFSLKLQLKLPQWARETNTESPSSLFSDNIETEILKN